MAMVVTGQQGIADMFGVSRETIDNWQRDGMPVAERGGPGVPSLYDATECINWLLTREVKKVQGEKPQDRLARVQADKIELELAEKRGLLLPADQIEPKLRAAMVAAREMWRNEPARLAREVPGKTIKEMEDLLALSYEAFLVKLSRWQDVQIVENEEGDE